MCIFFASVAKYATMILPCIVLLTFHIHSIICVIMHDFPNICSLLDSQLVACAKLQVVCGDGGGVSKGARGEALVCRVTAVVPGTSETAARQALHVASGDYQGAVQYLKVEKLYRSGLVLFVLCCLCVV